MSYLFPSMFESEEGGIHVDVSLDTVMGKTFEEIIEDRKQKYLHIISILIDKGLTELGIVQALEASVSALGGQSITEFFTKNEGDDAYELVKQAAEGILPD